VDLDLDHGIYESIHSTDLRRNSDRHQASSLREAGFHGHNLAGVPYKPVVLRHAMPGVIPEKLTQLPYRPSVHHRQAGDFNEQGASSRLTAKRQWFDPTDSVARCGQVSWEIGDVCKELAHG